MSDIIIDLTDLNDRFIEKSKLVLNKKVSFVFGKNGTGKTTIVKAIKEKYSDTYDIHIFDGYQGIIGENEALDAIALGTENAEIQKAIEKNDKEIVLIVKELNSDQLEENLIKKANIAIRKFEEQNIKIQDFFTNSASTIKNETNPQIALTSYNKNGFENEISQSKLLSNEEISKFQKIIKEDKKDNVIKVIFPAIESNEYLQKVNSILGKAISIQTPISELDENREKQNFAKEGLKIHKHENGERCAFCGNEISEERWNLLGKYFNTEVLDLENVIETLLLTINQELENIENITLIDKDQFYEQFKQGIEICNTKIQTIKSEYKLFLNTLRFALEEKKKNLFIVSNLLTLTVPQDFSIVDKEYEAIVDKNNTFSKNLENEKTLAKDGLRYHEIKKALDNFQYEAENQKLKDLNEVKKQIENEVNDKKNELTKKQEERKKLIEQTKDEGQLAEQINKCLKNTGLESFTLELVTGIAPEKGQYKVKGHDGEIRSIKKLSDGEKNIIAFLYFVLKLQSPEIATSSKISSKIIIFDDPMTSNDDTMQYLMISKIQNLYGNLLDTDKFLLLTHNIHFYLNVRPYYNKAEDDKEKDPNKKYHKKNHYFKLHSNGKLTEIISIESSDNDFKSNYHALREDLLYLYKNDKPLSMINNSRRILETYMNFHCCDINKFYKDNEEAKKLFNVNSHGIQDLENEPNGKTCEQVKSILQGVLKSNNAEEHFSAYFPN